MTPLSHFYGAMVATTNLEALYLSHVCAPFLLAFHSHVSKGGFLYLPRFFHLLENARIHKASSTWRGGGGMNSE